MRRSEPEAPPASPAASLRTVRLADAAETALWLAATAGGAAWAAHVGTLPGGHRGAGAAVQGAVWACLFVGLGLTYGTPAMPDRGARQRVVRAVGIVLALALLSTQGCRLWLQARLGPAVWGELFYARWLVPLAPKIVNRARCHTTW